MLKKILIGVLAAVVIVAVGTSAYRAYATSQAATAVQAGSASAMLDGQGQSRGQGGGAQGQQTANTPAGTGGRWGQQGGKGHGAGNGTGVPVPQNGLTEWVTFQGTVSNIALPAFTLTTTDGQQINVELGSINYLSEIGLTLQDGDTVTLTGFYDPQGSVAVGTLTLDASGTVFTLRDELGRPMWSGGRTN